MPRIDGIGPIGMGTMTGRGMGLYNTTKTLGAIGGLGLVCRRGFTRSGFNNTIDSQNLKDLLNEQKTILENRLELINNQLNNFEDDK